MAEKLRRDNKVKQSRRLAGIAMVISERGEREGIGTPEP